MFKSGEVGITIGDSGRRRLLEARGGRREGVEGGSVGPRPAAVNWNFENFHRIVFTLNFVMWVKVKSEFRAVCAARFTRLQS